MDFSQGQSETLDTTPANLFAPHRKKAGPSSCSPGKNQVRKNPPPPQGSVRVASGCPTMSETQAKKTPGVVPEKCKKFRDGKEDFFGGEGRGIG